MLSQNLLIWKKGLFKPTTFRVRDQDATTAPARHRLQTGSINWPRSKFERFWKFSDLHQLFIILRVNTNAGSIAKDWQQSEQECLPVGAYRPRVTSTGLDIFHHASWGGLRGPDPTVYFLWCIWGEERQDPVQWSLYREGQDHVNKGSYRGSPAQWDH